MKPSNKNSRARIASAGRTLTTYGVAAAVVGAVTIVPPSDPPPQRTVPAVDLTAASLPLAVRQQLQELRAGAVIAPQQLNSAAPVPTASRPTLPTPPTIQPPVVTAQEFEDAIINTYHAIEPWVRYGFELATYAVGWVPWVGWLAPQIMIFYDFGERIVESLVVNSANWLWGPLPFGEGLANVARDSWDALVQLGRDEWNFWLPPLPPRPPFALAAEQVPDPAQDGIPAPADESASSSAGRPHPVRDALLALTRSVPVPPGAPHSTVRPRWLDRIVHQPAAPDTESATPDDEVNGSAGGADSHDSPSAGSDEPPSSGRDDESANTGSRDTDETSQVAPSESKASSAATHTPRFRGAREGDRRGLLNRHEARNSAGTPSGDA